MVRRLVIYRYTETRYILHYKWQEPSLVPLKSEVKFTISNPTWPFVFGTGCFFFLAIFLILECRTWRGETWRDGPDGKGRHNGKGRQFLHLLWFLRTRDGAVCPDRSHLRTLWDARAYRKDVCDPGPQDGSWDSEERIKHEKDENPAGNALWYQSCITSVW